METYDLSRFTEKHRQDFERAYAEIKAGKKVSHWMWYIFPQIKNLGFSDMSRYYAISDIGEAMAFLEDAYLGGNLRNICNALLSLESTDAVEIMGVIDAKKLRSSMTLFACASANDKIFGQVLDKFFAGKPDGRTMGILGM